MKSPIVLRANFRQPRGEMNPMNIPMPGSIPVELFQDRVNPESWAARRPGTKIRFRITPQMTLRTLQSQMCPLFFEAQATPWEAFDIRWEPARALTPDDWRMDKDGKPQVTERYEEVRKDEMKKNVVTK